MEKSPKFHDLESKKLLKKLHHTKVFGPKIFSGLLDKLSELLKDVNICYNFVNISSTQDPDPGNMRIRILTQNIGMNKINMNGTLKAIKT